MLINALFRQNQSMVFENFLMFVFHPKHLSTHSPYQVSSPHWVSCHSPRSWQDAEIPSPLLLQAGCVFSTAVSAPGGAVVMGCSPKDNQWSGCCGSKSSSCSSGCDAEMAQKQDQAQNMGKLTWALLPSVCTGTPVV